MGFAGLKLQKKFQKLSKESLFKVKTTFILDEKTDEQKGFLSQLASTTLHVISVCNYSAALCWVTKINKKMSFSDYIGASVSFPIISFWAH